MCAKKLSELFSNIPFEFSPTEMPDIAVTGIAIDSRIVKPGDLFVAMQGGSVDGHDYIPMAIDKGAVAVVGQRDVKDLSVPYIQIGKPASIPDLFGCFVLRLAGSQADSDRRDRHGWQDDHL